MRLSLLVLPVFLAAAPILSETAPIAVAADAKPSLNKAAALDAMFAELRRAKNDQLANDIANRIKLEWNQSGSATIDLLMQWASEAMDRKDFPAALDFLDQVVVLKPDFAEGWNRRATLHFLTGNFSKSMVDIERTLALEPRHFGALAGMGMIFLDLGKKEPALSAYRRALEVYPQMRDIQKQVGDLEEQLAGSRI
jgi:tetratricopeptide (TPR) repeat protein